MFPFDQFMGVNTLRDDPVDKMDCVGFIREYHDWVVDEGDHTSPIAYGGGEICDNGIDDDGDGLIDCDDIGPAGGNSGCICGSPPYPNNEFLWNPPFQGSTATQFDLFYDQMQANGLTICADMTRSLPIYAGHSEYEFLERIPIDWIDGSNPPLPLESTNLPNSYTEHADWFYNFAARYGSSQLISPAELKYHESESPVTGRGNVAYVESWNEQDKIWVLGGENINNLFAYQFTPAEYAAMSSMDYDGNDGEYQALRYDDNGNAIYYNVGVKYADPNMKYVMGGTYCLNESYLLDLRDELVTLRPNDPEPFIFDVLNFHHYSFAEADGTIPGTGCEIGLNGINIGTWLSPEDDGLRGRLENMVNLRNSDPSFAGRELWLSEFGYDDFYHATPNGPDLPLVPGKSPQEIVADWTVRAFMEIAASGFDRAMVYALKDVPDDAGIGAWTVHSGLLDAGGSPKRSWWYVKSLKNILTGKYYDGQLILDGCTGNEASCGSDCSDCHECTRIYKFRDEDIVNPCDNPESEIWALWSPTSCGVEYVYDLTLNCGEIATGIILQEGSETGIHIDLETYFDGVAQVWKAKVPVSETPIFVYEDTNQRPECVEFLEAETSCFDVTLNWEIPDGQDYDSYSVYYAPGNIADPDCPASNELTLFLTGLNGQATSVSVTGLTQGASYYFYVIPQNQYGIPYDPTPGMEKAIWCRTDLTVVDGEEHCYIPIDQTMVYSNFTVPDDPGVELFDEQNIDVCGGQIPESAWHDWGTPDENAEVWIDLGDNYDISYFLLYDGDGAAQYHFEYAETQFGPWIPMTSYFSSGWQEWVSINDFTSPLEGIKYLRIWTESDNALLGKIEELFICGEEVVDPNPLPPVAINPESKIYCKTAVLYFEYDFDDEYNFEIWVSTDQNPEPNPAEDININNTGVTFNNIGDIHWAVFQNDPLECGTDYRFFIRAVDDTGATSMWSFMDFSTIDCNDIECSFMLCDCDFLELKDRQIFDYDYGKGTITANTSGAAALVDEQVESGNPICSVENQASTSWTLRTPYQSEYAVLDLGNEYEVLSISMYAGQGKGAIHIAPGRPGRFEHFELHSSREPNDAAGWITWSDKPIQTQYLLLKLEGERPNFKEIKICTRPLKDNVSDDIFLTAKSCSSLSFGIEPDIERTNFDYAQVWYSASGPFVKGQHPKSTNSDARSIVVSMSEKAFNELPYPNFTIENLSQQSNYNFAYKLYSSTGQSSSLQLINSSKTTSCPNTFFDDTGFLLDENCDIKGVNWSFVKNLKDVQFEVRESNMRRYNPSSDITTKTIIEENDLGQYNYRIVNSDTRTVFMRLITNDGSSTNWIVWDIDQDVCTDSGNSRSSSYQGSYLNRYHNDAEVILFPNPVSNKLYIELNTDRFEGYEIFDAMGTKWMDGTIDNTFKEMKVDVSNLNDGVYILYLKSSNSKWKSMRFVVSD